MIEKELTFYYNHNYKYLFDITTNNNQEILKIIDDLKEYKQGTWNKDKRKDIIQFVYSDIPQEFKLITDMIIKDNIIPLKLKIRLLEENDQRIVMKVKTNLINKISNLIYKLINIKLYVTINNNDNGNSSIVKVKYVIKSLLPESFITKIDNYIDGKVNDRFIKKIDNYLSNLK